MARGLLARWLLLTLALLITIYALPALGVKGIQPEPSIMLVLAALAIGLLNLLVHPVLWVAKLLTFPLSCLTLGLWTLFLSLFVNALVFYFVGTLHWGFSVTGFLAAFLGGAAMSLVNAFLNGVFAAAAKGAKA